MSKTCLKPSRPGASLDTAKYFIEVTTNVTSASGSTTPIQTGKAVRGSGLLRFCHKTGSFKTESEKEVVEIAINQGAVIPASSISLLTSKGQLLTSDGTQNVVLNPGPDGLVLTTDSTESTGLRWTSPGAVSGVIAPVPLTIPLRDATGKIYGVGYITSGDIMPDAASIRSVGSSAVPFQEVHADTINAANMFVNGMYGANNSVIQVVDPTNGGLQIKKWNGVTYELVALIGAT